MSLQITWSSNNYTIASVDASGISQVIAQTSGVIQGVNTSALTNSNVTINIQSTQVNNTDTSVTLFEEYNISLYVSQSSTVGNITLIVSYTQPPSSDENFTTLTYVSVQSVNASGCFSNYNTGQGVIQYLNNNGMNDRVVTLYEP